jgi:putative DNA primase/helicase
MALARAIVEANYMWHGVPTILSWQEEFWCWKAGAWSATPVSEVSAAVYAFLERANERPSRHRVGDVIDALKAATYQPLSTRPPCWLEGRESCDVRSLIVCRNGAVDVLTGERLAPTPRLFSLNALPINYDSTAPEPTQWLTFLRSIWGEDAHSIATLQELAGYLLTPRTEFQKIFLLVGPKRSGKGTILRTLAALLGTDNVAAPTLSSLAMPFGLQPLIGKLAALIGDVRLGSRVDQSAIVERLLSISGEDHVSVSRKFMIDFTGRLPVRFVMSTNELPRLTDSSAALASRFIVLLFQQSFYDREDYKLEQRIRSELPSILNWSIAGHRRLFERERFLQPESAREAIEELNDLGSPITAFLREGCEIGPGRSVPVKELYAAWRSWCNASGCDKPGSEQTFGRDLRAVCPGIKVAQPREGDDRHRIYKGIGLARSGTHA